MTQTYRIAFTDKNGCGNFQYVDLSPDDSMNALISMVQPIIDSYLENICTNMLGIRRELVRRIKVYKYDRTKRKAERKAVLIATRQTLNRPIKLGNGIWGTIKEYDYYLGVA